MKRLIIIVAVLAFCVALYFVVSTLIKQNEPAISALLVRKQIRPQTLPTAEQKTTEPGPAVTKMAEIPLEEDAGTPAEAPTEEAAPLPAAAGNRPVSIPSIKELKREAAVPQSENIVPAIFGSGSTTALPSFEGGTSATGPIAPSDESQPLPISPAPASPQLISEKGAASSTRPQPNITGPMPREGYTSQPLPDFTPVTSDKGPVPSGNKEN